MQNTISGSQGPGINDLCLSATVAHCAGATDKKKILPPTSGTNPAVLNSMGSRWQEDLLFCFIRHTSLPRLWLTRPRSGRGLLPGMHSAYFFADWFHRLLGYY